MILAMMILPFSLLCLLVAYVAALGRAKRADYRAERGAAASAELIGSLRKLVSALEGKADTLERLADERALERALYAADLERQIAVLETR